MKHGLLLIPVLALLIGCRNDTDGVDHEAVHNAQAPLKAAAKRTGGDWSKLTADEKKLYLDRARGNEGSAKMMFGMFSSGPPAGPPKH